MLSDRNDDTMIYVLHKRRTKHGMKHNTDEWTTVIRPKAGWFDIDLKDIWHYRDLIVMFLKTFLTRLTIIELQSVSILRISSLNAITKEFQIFSLSLRIRAIHLLSKHGRYLRFLMKILLQFKILVMKFRKEKLKLSLLKRKATIIMQLIYNIKKGQRDTLTHLAVG